MLSPLRLCRRLADLDYTRRRRAEVSDHSEPAFARKRDVWCRGSRAPGNDARDLLTRRVGKVSLWGPLKLHWQIGSPSLVAGGLGVEPTKIAQTVCVWTLPTFAV